MKDFLTALKHFFQVNYRELRLITILSLGVGAVGMITVLLLMIAADSPDGYLDAGGLLTMVCGGMMICIYNIFTLSHKFYMAATMGMARKYFLGAAYCFYILETIIILALAKLISLVEIAIYGALFPESICEFTSTVWLGNPIALFCVIFGLPVILLFLGVSWMRFKCVFWILWALWMFGCLGVPRMISATTKNPDSLPGRFGNAVVDFFRWLPPAALILGIVAIIFACIYGTIHLMKKQTVTV